VEAGGAVRPSHHHRVEGVRGFQPGLAGHAERRLPKFARECNRLWSAPGANRPAWRRALDRFRCPPRYQSKLTKATTSPITPGYQSKLTKATTSPIMKCLRIRGGNRRKVKCRARSVKGVARVFPAPISDVTGRRMSLFTRAQEAI
jgi:hypothetical protein